MYRVYESLIPQGASQAMLHAVGMKKEDLNKAQAPTLAATACKHP